MLCACDFCCGDGPTFQGGKQNTAEGVPNGVTVTGFEWLGSKFCVGICGCALVLTESFRHFKTTVTDWYLQFSNVDFRLAIEDREWPNNRNSKILNRNSFCRRVPPGECGLASSDGDPGTNGTISKTRCGASNKREPGIFASSHFMVGVTAVRGFPRFRPISLQ